MKGATPITEAVDEATIARFCESDFVVLRGAFDPTDLSAEMNRAFDDGLRADAGAEGQERAMRALARRG